MPAGSEPPGALADRYRTLEHLVYDEIRRAIVAGRYKPGEPIVASRLAQSLGVSRNPTTVALKRLQSEGFLRSDPHKVITVAVLSAPQVREIYAMRGALEALAAREAARSATAPQLAELRRLAMAYADDLASATPRAEAPASNPHDRQFHHLLRVASGMPLLATTLDNLFDKCEYYRTLIGPLQSDAARCESVHDHLEIVAALERGDADSAAAASARHVEVSAGRLLAYMRRETDGPTATANTQ